MKNEIKTILAENKTTNNHFTSIDPCCVPPHLYYNVENIKEKKQSNFITIFEGKQCPENKNMQNCNTSSDTRTRQEMKGTSLNERCNY